MRPPHSNCSPLLHCILSCFKADTTKFALLIVRMSYILSRSDATPSGREVSTDFTLNPDVTGYLNKITATQFSSSDTLVSHITDYSTFRF